MRGFLEGAIDGTHPVKFILWSGHDTTFIPLLTAIAPGAWDKEWPPYATLATIELLWIGGSLAGDYFRLVYNGQVIRLDGCHQGEETKKPPSWKWHICLTVCSSYPESVGYSRRRKRCTVGYLVCWKKVGLFYGLAWCACGLPRRYPVLRLAQCTSQQTTCASLLASLQTLTAHVTVSCICFYKRKSVLVCVSSRCLYTTDCFPACRIVVYHA